MVIVCLNDSLENENFNSAGMVMNRAANAGNGAALWLAKTAASAVSHAVKALMAGLCIHGPPMTQDWSMTRRAEAGSGKTNTRKGFPWSGPTSAKKKTIN